MYDDLTEEDDSLDSGKRGHNLLTFLKQALELLLSTIRYGYGGTYDSKLAHAPYLIR